MTRFVDVHVHPPTARFLEVTLAPFVPGLERVAGEPLDAISGDDLAEHYRSRDGRAVLLGWDAETATGAPPLSSAHVAALVGAHPDVFVGFGAVDPHKGAKAISGVAETKRLGLVGLSFHPAAQRFDPADRRFGSIWEVAEELELVALVHTGFSRFGAGEPGGAGVDLSFGDPLLMDRVAADFPGLRIVLAHSSPLWVDRAIAVARHKANVWVDLAGWSPKRFPADLLDALRGPLGDVTLFGSGYPFGDVDGWLSAWEGLGMSDDLTDRVLRRNAARLLGLDGQSS